MKLLIDQKLYTRGLNGKPVKVYVIVGDGSRAGHIKTCRVSHTSKPDCLDVTYKRDGQNRACAVEAVDVTIEHHKRGWKLLADAYREEGNEKGYEIWLDFQRACEEKRVDKFQGHESAEALTLAIAEGKAERQVIPGFPNRLLPKACLDLANQKAKRESMWIAPEEPKAKK